MSISKQILELAKRMPGLTNRQIALKLGSTTSYVRVVRNQRKGGRSHIDAKYEEGKKGKLNRQLTNAAVRRYVKVLRDTSDQDGAKREQARAYREARDQGLTPTAARKHALKMRARFERATGNKAEAKWQAALVRERLRLGLDKPKDKANGQYAAAE